MSNKGFKLASSWDGGSFLTGWDAGSFETVDKAQAEADKWNRENPYEDSSIVVVRDDGAWPDGTPANWDEPA